MKAGYKTTEFWFSLLVFLLGAALASGLIADGTSMAKAIGGALSLLSSLGYTAGRVGVKKADSIGSAYIKGPTKKLAEGTKENPTQESD